MSDIKELSVRELLSTDRYRIPIYQRNYAWSMVEVSQLIQDIADYAKDNRQNYHIGNLIVFPKSDADGIYYETIDGQQRTTMLSLLMCAIKNQKDVDYPVEWYTQVNISFDHRNQSNVTLSSLYGGNKNDWDMDNINPNILNVYDSVWNVITKTCEAVKIDIKSYLDYFLNKVMILRIRVPKETNLNHYFEIMNSRGEQLEQHEIVKAMLIKPLGKEEYAMKAFNLIWEACANMDRYVQMNFNSGLRRQIFDNNGTGLLNANIDFEVFAEIMRQNNLELGDDIEEESLVQLFEDQRNNKSYHKPWVDYRADEDSESFQSVIMFPNFLLQVAKILDPENELIVLDDKKLSSIFKRLSNVPDAAEYSKTFIMALLKVRIFFDKYVIKRKQEKWTLQSISPLPSDRSRVYYPNTFTESSDNKQLIMLESLFHVSRSTQNYKWWLFALLSFLYKESDVTSRELIAFLEDLARTYMLDRYLSSDPLDIDTMIIKNGGKPKGNVNTVCWENINIGKSSKVGEKIENFVYNYFDYVLWKDNKEADFEFAYRTSVEHFYPQHPIGRPPMDFRPLHSFGNLCIISRGMNSKFSNYLPTGKAGNFGDADSMKTYSLKLQYMINSVKNKETWDEATILRKEQEAKELLKYALTPQD